MVGKSSRERYFITHENRMFKFPHSQIFTGTQPHPFSNVYGYICATMTKLNGFDRDHMTCRAENIYPLAFYRNSSLTPALCNSGKKFESKLYDHDESVR